MGFSHDKRRIVKLQLSFNFIESPGSMIKPPTNENLNHYYYQQLERCELPGSTMKSKGDDLVLERGLEEFLWDVSGRRYLDLSAGFGSLPLGHNHPSVWSDLFSPGEGGAPYVVQGLGDVYANRWKVELLALLDKVTPSFLSSASLSVTGGQAVEFAMKAASVATKSQGFISFEGGYHGLDLGVLPVTSRSDFRKPFAPILKENHVERLPYGCDPKEIQEAMDRLASRGISTAGVIVEPILGRGGVVLPPGGWLQELRQVCDLKGILLIYDEVLTGLARTGLITHAEQVPCDLLCLGKALGGGMPLSVCLGTQEVMGAWPTDTPESIHTGTFFGHGLSCLVGYRTLSQIMSQNLSKRAAGLGKKALEFLRGELLSSPFVQEVRGQGLMMGVQFTEAGMGVQMMEDLKKQGVIVIPGGSRGDLLSLTPPLNIGKEHFWEALGAICQLTHSYRSS